MTGTSPKRYVRALREVATVMADAPDSEFGECNGHLGPWLTNQLRCSTHSELLARKPARETRGVSGMTKSTVGCEKHKTCCRRFVVHEEAENALAPAPVEASCNAHNAPAWRTQFIHHSSFRGVRALHTSTREYTHFSHSFALLCAALQTQRNSVR